MVHPVYNLRKLGPLSILLNAVWERYILNSECILYWTQKIRDGNKKRCFWILAHGIKRHLLIPNGTMAHWTLNIFGMSEDISKGFLSRTIFQNKDLM